MWPVGRTLTWPDLDCYRKVTFSVIIQYFELYRIDTQTTRSCHKREICFFSKRKQKDKKNFFQNNKLRERGRACVSLFANTWGQEDEKSFLWSRFFSQINFFVAYLSVEPVS